MPFATAFLGANLGGLVPALVYNLTMLATALLNLWVVRRALAHAALITDDGSLVMAAHTDADFPMPDPPPGAAQQAAGGETVLIEPRTRNIVGAIVKLREIPDTYLYTIRLVDPEVIRARQIVRANTDEYRGLEANRRTTQLAFAMLYLGLTLVVVLSAIWTGIAVADRLVRPIRQLIGAADEVATGNLDVSVPVRASDGDVASAQRRSSAVAPTASRLARVVSKWVLFGTMSPGLHALENRMRSAARPWCVGMMWR